MFNESKNDAKLMTYAATLKRSRTKGFLKATIRFSVNRKKNTLRRKVPLSKSLNTNVYSRDPLRI